MRIVPYEPQTPQAFVVKKPQRVPEYSHAEFLLWMANQNLIDLIIMSGIRTGKGGLESTRPATE